MLDGLFATPAVTAITEALASAGIRRGAAGARPRIAVVGHPRIAALLAADHDVIPVGMTARAARKLPGALPDTQGLADGSLDAVIGLGGGAAAGGDAALRGWVRVVRDGGAVVIVDRPGGAFGLAGPDRGHAAEASRRALCAGLTELEQRRVGRAVITSGLVTHL